MKSLLLLLILQLTPPAIEVEKYQEVETVLTKMYNHTRLLTADKEAEGMALALLTKYPDDPYVYHLWASAEWLLIGRELNLKADEQKDISAINDYQERAERYRQLVDKGLALTENAADEKLLFLRGALEFDHAKFSARYESRLSGLRRADKEAAEGVKILRSILQTNPRFCSAYLLLGGNRFQISVKTNAIEKLLAWKFSKVYSELYAVDKDVFNEQKSVSWLERAYRCESPELWSEQIELEAGFLLAEAYRHFGKQQNIKDELAILKKEVPLLNRLSGTLPQNSDLSKMLAERELRLKILTNYFSKK